jgi:hypothetical protein
MYDILSLELYSQYISLLFTKNDKIINNKKAQLHAFNRPSQSPGFTRTKNQSKSKRIGKRTILYSRDQIGQIQTERLITETCACSKIPAISFFWIFIKIPTPNGKLLIIGIFQTCSNADLPKFLLGTTRSVIKRTKNPSRH